ncbi:MAG: ParB-like nuclease domain-containing protein [Eggerthellaceae bacterium]|nr:ParB-like nuclease domain-containing protein [Eggerthellaceae bacterium]
MAKTTKGAKQVAKQAAMRMENVPLDQLFDHPANDYPTNEHELADLIDSIRRDGLAQLPLVREVDGGYQIIAGHRRVESYRRLAAEDASYAVMPVNVLPDCDDERALVLLEVTNLMMRQLSTVERARRFERLWDIVPSLREKSPDLKGVRTSQVIADIVTRETGNPISRASVDRVLAAGRRAQEVNELVDAYSDSLIAPWRGELLEREGFSTAVVKAIATRDGSVQEAMWADYQRDGMTPKQFEKSLEREATKSDVDVEHALDSVIRTLRDVSAWHKKYGAAVDMYRVDYIRGQLDKLTRG